MKNKIILILGLSLFILSCKNKKNATEELSTSTGTIAYEDFLWMAENDTTSFNYMSSKVKLTIDNDGKSNSVKLFLKSTRDSAFLANVSILAIPLARALVTKDSLILTQNREKCYRRSSADDLKQLLPVTVDYEILEAVLHASTFGFDTSFNYFMFEENGMPVLSTHNEKVGQWLDKEKYNKTKEIPQVVRYYLSDSLKNISRIRIHLPSDSAEINVYYDEKQIVDGFLAPSITRLVASNPRNTVHIKLEYERIKLNEPHYLSLSIPDNYESCP